MGNRGRWTAKAREAHASWKGKAVVEVSETNGKRCGESRIKDNHCLRSQSSNHSVSGFGSNVDMEKLADNIEKTNLIQNSGDDKDSTSKGDDLIEISVTLGTQQEGKTKDRGTWKRTYKSGTKKTEVNSTKGLQCAKKRKPEENDDQSGTKKLYEVGYVL